GARQSDRLRKARGLLPFEAVEGFLVEQHRNPETRVLLHPALDGVGEFRLRPSAVTFARSLDASDADAEPVGHARRIEPAGGVRHGPLPLPETQHLADLLFECHAGEEVVDAALHREARIQVGAVLRDLGGRYAHRCGHAEQGAKQRAGRRDGHQYPGFCGNARVPPAVRSIWACGIGRRWCFASLKNPPCNGEACQLSSTMRCHRPVRARSSQRVSSPYTSRPRSSRMYSRSMIAGMSVESTNSARFAASDAQPPQFATRCSRVAMK